MINYLKEFPYKAEEIITNLESFKKIKVLVIGDAIIDQYHYCTSIGKAPKENIIVVKHLSEENFAGGVLAAANHIAGFCDNVTLVTCLGQHNTWERFILNHLKENIKSILFHREDTSTVVKRRFVEPESLKKMFGISFLDDYDLSIETEKQVCEYIESVIRFYDLVVVNDFGHGFLNKNIIKVLDYSNFLAVNTQTNTDNAGFNLITKYQWADYICLDEPELRLACQNKYEGIGNLILEISEKLDCNKIAITHGSNDTVMYSSQFYRIPILSQEIVDTTGAGDAFFAITALCVQAGFPMDMVGFIGNAVGALKVKSVCNRTPIEKEQLYEFIRSLL